MNILEIFDTTLRDGTQGEGINLSVEDKLKIALKLDDFGINILEGGWPGSNPKDKEFFKQAKKVSLKQAEFCAFGSTARFPDKVDSDKNLKALLDAETPIITIFGKTWSLHSEKCLGLNEHENLKLIEESVSYLEKRDRRVIFDAEHFFDGYKESPSFAIKMINAAKNGGADTIVLCDTNGGSLPSFIDAATRDALKKCNTQLGIHVHNDGGLATANTLAAVSAGVTHVQGTINGVGERGGNASLGSILPNLIIKMNEATKSKIDLEKLTSLTNFVYDVMNLRSNDQAPFVGKSSFAHKGGIHVSAVMKDSKMYEHIEPSLVGNTQRVLVSDLSGKSNIKYKAKELKIDLKDNKEIAKDLVADIKKMEYKGYQFEGAEASFELMVLRKKGVFIPYFDVVDSRVNVSYDQLGENKTDATLKVKVNNDIEHTAADGVGPVDALNNALRKALLRFYPNLKKVNLTDYKVRVLNEKDGTQAKVRVLIESSDGESHWSTVGVSENIIEATWQSLSDSFNYHLMKKDNYEKRIPYV